MKLLSIIIPAYNMEAYLSQCIESILRTPSLAAVEVIIVNDGSKDKTLRIANQYAERHSDTIRIIDKPNGNYGSTINAALPTAKGKFVKILDADDTFSSSHLAEFLTFLDRMQGVDMVVTPFTEVNKQREHRVDYNLYSRKVYEYGKIYDVEQIFGDGAIRFFMMHGVCYRTELLRQMNYRQSEGISYTDQEWVFYPLFNVKSIAFADIPLYRYNTSREGQTMEVGVQLRSLSQLIAVTEAIARYFASNSNSIESTTRTNFLRNIVADRIRIVYRKYLLVMPNAMFAASNFGEIDKRLTTLLAQCGIEELSVPVNNMLKVDLLAHWRRKERRYGLARKILLWADRSMSIVHTLLFRRK